MTGVPEHHGLLRSALIGSLMFHLVLAFVPWGGFVAGEAEESAGNGDFEVSLIPGVAGGEESPDESDATAIPPTETVPELDPDPDPVAPVEFEPEPTQPTPDESNLPPQDAALPPQDAADVPATGVTGAATPGGVAGSPAIGVGAPPSPFRPPRLLAGALPIDPDDSEELNVPAEIPVRLRIGTDGMVKEVIPADPDLPPKVIEALELSAREMKFSPARRGDQIVEAWFQMTFVYRK